MRIRTESSRQAGDVVVEEMQPGELEALVDREARELLNLSGEEFARRWGAGEFRHLQDPRISDLAILLP